MDELETRSQDDIRAKRVVNVYLMLLGVVIGIAIVIVLPMVQSATQTRHGTPRIHSKNKLKQVGLSFHNYHDAEKRLPDEALGQSWATQLLPYLDYADVHSALDHSKPWNDPANEPKISEPIQPLLNPSFSMTHDSRNYALSHYAGNSNWLTPGAVVNFSGVTDGMSHTVLAGEIANGFMPWAQPGNLRDPSLGINKGPTTFGHPRRDRTVHFLMGDGSVRTLREGIDPTVLKALSTPSGGEVIPADSY